MSERPTYREASFRGVPFFVDSSDTEIGRRLATHEYVNENIPYIEDMGRKARQFSVTAYLLGDDHLGQARILQRAIEAEGEAELILPSRQTEQVYCLDARRSDDTQNEQRITRFQMTFVEAGQFRFPGGGLSTITQLLDSAEAAISSIVEDIRAPFQSAVAAANRIAETANRIGDAIGSLSLIESDISNIFESLRNIGQNSPTAATAEALISLGDFASAIEPAHSGPMANLEYQEALDFDQKVRLASYLEAARRVSQLEFTNRSQASSIRDQIADGILQNIEGLDAEAVQAALFARRAALTDIASRIVTLPSFIEVDMGQSLPSVVVAHEVLGDYTREAELREWNSTLHPLFMPQVIQALR